MGLLGDIVTGAKGVIKGGRDEYIPASESTQSLEDFDEKSASKPVSEPVSEPVIEPVSEPVKKKKKKKDEYIEPGEGYLQKDYVGITSEKLKSELKTDVDLEPVDATLEAIPIDKDTITPAISAESDYMDLNVPSETTSKTPETPVTAPIPTVDETKKGLFTKVVDEIFKKKQLITKEEAEKNLIDQLRGSGESSITKEREYAILGGYKGTSREQLLSENEALLKDNINLKGLIAKLNDEIFIATAISKKYQAESLALKDPSYNTINARAQQLKILEADVTRLEAKKTALEARISANNKTIKENNLKIYEYDEAVLKGKKSGSSKTLIYKKLQKLGEGAGDVSSGVYGGKSFGKGDWFGDKGFLSQPFKQANITRSPLEPIKTSSRSLDNITRSTGGSVARSMIDVTKVQPNKNIAPMGAPGTIYGARQQFDYNIPARKISLLDASGMTRSNINRDILPNLYDAPKPAQVPMQQYKQVVQEDGTVTNVPVYYRKSKLFTISVNRYPTTKFAKMKFSAPVKKNDRLTRGVESVGSTNGMKFTVAKFTINKPPVTKPKSSKMNKLIRGVESVGSIKVNKVMPDAKVVRKQFDLGLINVKNIGITVNDSSKNNVLKTLEPVKEYRKSKETSSLVKMGFTLTGVKLNQNLKKLVLKHKTK